MNPKELRSSAEIPSSSVQSIFQDCSSSLKVHDAKAIWRLSYSAHLFLDPATINLTLKTPLKTPKESDQEKISTALLYMLRNMQGGPMRKSAKTWSFFPIVQLPARTEPSSQLFSLSHTQTPSKLSKKCKSNLWVSEKSVEVEQTWYFPSWLCKVTYLTLRISVFLTKVQLPPSTEFYHPIPHDGKPGLWWTVSQPEDHWVISLVLDILFFSRSCFLKLQYHQEVLFFFLVWAFWCLVVRVLGFLNGETSPREIPTVLLRQLLL